MMSLKIFTTSSDEFINWGHYYIISRYLFAPQAAALPISSGVTVDSVLIQHWPAIEYILIAVITVMRPAAHVS